MLPTHEEDQRCPPPGARSAYLPTTIRVRGDRQVLTPLTFDVKLNARK